MRVSALIIGAMAFTAQILLATPGRGQGNEKTVISLSFKKTPIQKVFAAIEAKADVVIMYENTSVLKDEKITISVKDKRVAEVLDVLLKGRSLKWSMRDNVIRVEADLPTTAKQTAQNVLISRLILGEDHPTAQPIKGRVTDSAGTPLSNASVIVKGGETGTSTDGKGEFSIAAGPGDYLVVSYIGFDSQTIAVKNADQFLSVVLRGNNSNLEEVVVGYGKQRKINLTGSVVSISKQQIENRGVANVSNIIAGQAPGVTVLQRGGPPGRDMGTLNIRGIGTLGNSNPLLIVDGIQTTDISQVNPNDIENISVLKDAASAAIYGINGANGVIIITTKRGVPGKLKVSYDFQGGFSQLGKTPKAVNSYELATLYNEAQTNDGIPASGLKFSASDVQKFQDGSSPYTHANTNWVDEVFPKSGSWFSHNLAFNGGNNDTKYNVSLGYLDQDGLMNNTGYKRYNFRTNFDQRISDRISTGFNIAASVREVNDPATVLGVGGETWYLHEAFQQWPNDPVQYADGRYAYPTWSGLNHNPVAYTSKANGYSKNSDTRLIGTGFAEIKILDGLKLKGIATNTRDYNNLSNLGLGVDLYRINPQTGQISPTPENAASMPAVASTRNVSRGFDRYSDLNLQLLLNYDKTFGKHAVKGLVGYEQRKITSESDGITRYNLSDPSLDQINAADPQNQSTYGNKTDFRSRSVFGRLNYIFNNRYLLEANLRYDESSRFPEGKRGKLFPAFSAGWILSKENFLHLPSQITNLKVRASWGRLGNQEIGDYLYLSTYTLSGQYVFDGTRIFGINEGALANQNITWETTTAKNIGFDLGMFGSKFSLSGDFFQRNTKDILLALPQPAILGAAPPTTNAGSVENTGFEFIASYKDRIGDVGFYVNANISKVNNKITDLKGTDVPGHRVGDPIYNLYGYIAEGIFQNQEEISGHTDQSGLGSVPKPGDIKYKDVTGDGIINASDERNLGTYFPKINYGFSFGGDYKNFDLSTIWQGVAQVNGVLSGRLQQPFGSFGSAPITAELDRWTPDGTNPHAVYPRLSFTAAANNLPSSWWLRNTSFLKLRNIQLGYSLPSSVAKRMKLYRVRIYLSGENLLTISPFKITDPETLTNTDPFLGFSGSSAYPVTKRFLAGLSVTF